MFDAVNNPDPSAAFLSSVTIAVIHRMQPYSHSADSNLYAHGNPEAPLSPAGSETEDASSLPEKRTGLEPPEAEEERMMKRARLETQAAAGQMFQPSYSPRMPMPHLSRPSMLGSQFPDAAFARYMVYHPAPSPLLHPSVFSSGFDMGGLPPPPLAMSRAPLLDPFAYAPAPLGFGAPPVPSAASPLMQSNAFAVHRRPSHGMLPRINSQGPPPLNQDHIPLPQLSTGGSGSGGGDSHHAHFSSRVCINISIDQDPNWLSELQVFVRKNLLEVCWASREDVAVRNASKKVTLDQVGIRCRYCAHKPPGSRAQRSSAFPSSIPQLYQSFTMMLRDHFDSCTCIPDDIKERYLGLKSATCQGATEAKKYWSYSAQRLGMVDSDDGIIMNEATRTAAKSIPAFGYVPGEIAVPKDREGRPVMLVTSADHERTTGFLYSLLSHFYRIELLPSERKGNRKSLRVGLPGFGCRHCSEAARFGMSRVFPARRRTLPSRVADLYDHTCRCNLCPQEDKFVLQRLREESRQDPAQEKQFLDQVWERLGHSQANP